MPICPMDGGGQVVVEGGGGGEFSLFKIWMNKFWEGGLFLNNIT